MGFKSLAPCVALALGLGVSVCSAQDDPNSAEKTVRIIRTEAAPTIDGRLDEAANRIASRIAEVTGQDGVPVAS